MGANQDTRLMLEGDPTYLRCNNSVSEVLFHAANAFVKNYDGTVKIWAADWDWFFEEWGRDTYIALPGLLLATGRFEDAKNNMRAFAKHEKNGLIPNRVHNSEFIEYNTVDASMWFIQSVKSYLDHFGDEGFAKEMLPVMTNILEGYINGTGYERYGTFQKIQMDSIDGLVRSPAQATWMDAAIDNRFFPTPRNGKAVEINALWYSNLKFIANMKYLIEKDSSSAIKYFDLACKVKASFNNKFWNPEENALYDVIEGDLHGGAIRPNMLIAVSHGGDLLSLERQKGVFYSAQKDLLTPGGLRTLSPRDSNYQGNYDTHQEPRYKDLAYHQGTVWPWLIGPYVDALVKVRAYEGNSWETIKSEIAFVISPLIKFCMENYEKHKELAIPPSIPEVFSGNPPHLPGGTRSQAWSVAEVLRVFKTYLV